MTTSTAFVLSRRSVLLLSRRETNPSALVSSVHRWNHVKRQYLSSSSNTTNASATNRAVAASIPSDANEKEEKTKQISQVKSLAELSKARLSALVVATSTVGFMAAGTIYPLSALAACSFGTALCSSSASTWNQIFEIDRDAKMKRTSHRPLVTGDFSVQTAMGLGTMTGLGGTALLYLGTDSLWTPVLGLANIGLYSGLYTYMKPRSEWNTWVGALVGAVPPVMGWTAAGGSPLDPEALWLASSLFLWQFPHFFALSWMHRVDYERGGFQMVPVNDPTGDRTAQLITRYTWYMSTLPFIATLTEITNSMFAIEGLVLNAYALKVAHNFDKDRTNANARKVFLTSLWYLPCLLTLFILHSKTWRDEETTTEAKNKGVGAMIQDYINLVRNTGRSVCVHEQIVNNNLSEDSAGGAKTTHPACPISMGKDTVSSAKETAKDLTANSSKGVASLEEK